MNEYKTSEAKRRANKKYDQNNPEGRQYRNKKSATKSFIRDLASDDDLELVQGWLEERLKKED